MIHSEFVDDMSLAEARDLLRELLRQPGAKLTCPCCTQMAAIYARPINGTMARSLAAMYRAWGSDWGYLPELRRTARLHHSNQEAQLRHFGLIAEHPDRREDGGHLGWWRVTDHGIAWLEGRTAVPQKARTYAGRFLQLVGEPVTVYDVLGKGFDLREVDLGIGPA